MSSKSGGASTKGNESGNENTLGCLAGIKSEYARAAHKCNQLRYEIDQVASLDSFPCVDEKLLGNRNQFS